MAVELSEKISSLELSFTPVDNRRLMDLCGRFDEHLRQIEKRMKVEIHNRGGAFQILGDKAAVRITHQLLNHLYAQTENGEHLTPAKVHLSLQESYQSLQHLHGKSLESHTEKKIPLASDFSIKTPKEIITPRSKTQRDYVQNILSNDIIFGIGPAGTGKTFIAVACAIAALESNQVRKIVLVRPVVEAGESLGFLPGDLSQKIDPYLRPLYDALDEMLGFERVSKLVERNVIELAPLAYMRGRTLSDAFIILDEAQNTTIEQMKMFLTRLGFGSTAVITGDVTQVDLRGVRSGLKQVIQVFHDIPRMNFTYFDSKDVVRHPIVQRIIEAYEKYEQTLPPPKEPK